MAERPPDKLPYRYTVCLPYQAGRVCTCCAALPDTRRCPMATERYVTIDGIDMPLGNEQLQYRTRCDDCSQLCPEDDRHTLTVTVTIPGRTPIVRQVDAHEKHIVQAFDNVMYDVHQDLLSCARS